jgi:hypothetical protein
MFCDVPISSIRHLLANGSAYAASKKAGFEPAFFFELVVFELLG